MVSGPKNCMAKIGEKTKHYSFISLITSIFFICIDIVCHNRRVSRALLLKKVVAYGRMNEIYVSFVSQYIGSIYRVSVSIYRALTCVDLFDTQNTIRRD